MIVSDRLKARLEMLGTGEAVKTIYSRKLVEATQTFYLLLRGTETGELAQKAGRLIDEAVFMHIEGGLQVDCKPGCNHCCHQRVSVTVPEMDMIMESKLIKLTIPLKLKLQTDAGDKFDELPVSDRACVFLEDFGCGIYNDRPLVCRLLHSKSESACIANNTTDNVVIDYAEAVYTAYLTVLRERALLKPSKDNTLHKQFYLRLLSRQKLL